MTDQNERELAPKTDELKPDAIGFYDATCPGCRQRMGWRGSLDSRPPCPRCGFHPDPETMETAAEAQAAKAAEKRAACKHPVRARATSGGMVCVRCGETWRPPDEAGHLQGAPA